MALQEFFNRVTGGPQKPQMRQDGPRRPQVPSKPTAKPVAVTDPDDPRMTVGSEDRVNSRPFEQSEADTRLVKDTTSAFHASATQRWIHEREWIMCLAFSVGNHYLPWRDSSNYPDLLIDPDDPERTFFYTNILGNMVLKKLKARLTMSKPDASTKPQTTKDVDIQAADEGRDILAHYDDLFNDQSQLQELVDIMLSTSTAFKKHVWNATAEAMVSYVDETGQPVASRAPVGDIEETICLPFEIYPDPQARYWSEVRWIIHAKRHPLDYFRERYGEAGWQVKPEAYSAATTLAGWWEQRLDQIYGEAYRTTAARYSEDSATEFEKWELPSVRFPKGRLIRCTESVLLEPYQDYPYQWPSEQNKFPFVPYSFCNKTGTLWGLNAIHDDIPAQRNIDQIGSRLFDRIDAEKAMWFKPTGSMVTTDDLQQRQGYAIIEHDPMLAPTIVTPPPVNDGWFNALNFFKQGIMDSVAVHEVSKAESDTTTSGIMVELLQEQDTTQLREAHDNIERGCKWSGEWRIALAAQFYKEPRLIAISQSGSSQTAAMNARSFEGLTGGGKCTVHVQPGSSIAKSPAARMAYIMDLMKSGGFTPQMMPLLMIAHKMLGLQQSDITTEQLQWAMQQMMQMEQQQQAAQAQAQAQAQSQAMQMEIQGKMMLAKLQAQVQIQTKMMELEIDNKYSMAIEQNKLNADSMIEAAKLKNQLTLAHQKSLDDMFANMHDFIAKAHLLQMEPIKPSVSISVKAGGQGTRAAEQLAGFPTLDDPSEIKEMNKPKPMTNGTGKALATR